MYRRQVLAGVAGTVTAGIAGCQGEAESGDEGTISCSTAVRESGDGDIQEASVGTRRPENGGPIAELQVVLDGDAIPEGPQDDRLGRLEITNSRDEFVHEVPIEEPTSTRRSYAVAIGPQPQHGQYRLALEVDGEPVDEMAIDFTCEIE